MKSCRYSKLFLKIAITKNKLNIFR